MKMMTITILMLSLFLSNAKAPDTKVVYIAVPEEINYYDALMRAIVMVESKGDIFAFNFLEQAAGPMQIRPCRINHYNKLVGSNYTTADCFDLELSRKVFLRFAQGKNYSQAAKDWNGSGPMTLDYWKLVKAKL